jgi:DNA-binding CsgD family transcriptional regulator/N-acetylneuraminic acid mutarotase
VSDEVGPLSEREMELLRLVATGATNQQIAQELVISVNTVKVHLRNIFAKLEVSSRTEATMVAVRHGWVAVPRTQHELEEEGAEESAARPAPRTLPHLERWPRVSLGKRASLVVATLLAVTILFLPAVLQGRANGEDADPIRQVFPAASPSSAGSRWRTRAQLPTPRTDLAVAAYKGRIYAIGGFSSNGVTAKVEIYDPQADAWTTGQAKPTPVGAAAAAVVDGRIYVPGGFGANQEPSDVLEIYDPAADQWEVRAPMPEPLGAYALAALDGQLYVFGGRGASGYVDSVYRYDPAADRWQTLSPMPQRRGFLSAAALGNLIYVVGGFDDVAEFKSCDAYDPATDTWTPRAPMALRRGGLAVVAVREHLYAIGGGMAGYLAFNERYDPRTNTWTRIGTPVAGQWRGLGVVFVEPDIYAIGGWNEGYLSTNEAYQAIIRIQIPIGP